MTGPYHILQSLDVVLKNYNKLRKSVVVNKVSFLKKYRKYLNYSDEFQPLICTYINKKIKSKNKKTVIYKSRLKIKGSVVNHLGEIHLGSKAKGEILNNLK